MTRGPRRTRLVAVLVLGAVLVNLPLVHATVTGVDGVGGLAVLTIVADLALLVAALLVGRYGGRPRADLEGVALEDVGRCPPGGLLERIAGEEYLVRGEVLDRTDDRVELDVGNRIVVVHLDGHANPVGHQQPAQVRVRLIS